LAQIGEGLELEGVAGGVEEEERGLLAGLALQRLWPKEANGLRLPDLEGFDDVLGGGALMGTALVLLLGR
jgi:hypothetical protein